MSKLNVPYLSLWMVDGNDDDPLTRRLKAYLIACARYVGTYDSQSMMVPHRMSVRQAIDVYANPLKLCAVEISTPVGGLPILACSRRSPNLVLLIPKGPQHFLVWGSSARAARPIHAREVPEHFKECIQLFRADLLSDLNQAVARYFPLGLVCLMSLAKLAFLSASVFCSVMLLFEMRATNQYLLLASAGIALVFALSSDIFIRNSTRQNISLVRLLAQSQVFTRIFSLDLERYARTSWGHVERVLALAVQGSSNFMVKTPELILALLIIAINIGGLWLVNFGAWLVLIIILALVLGLAYVFKTSIRRLHHREQALHDELERGLGAFQYSFAMAVGLKAQGPMLSRLSQVSQALQAKIAQIERLAMMACWTCFLSVLALVAFFSMLALNQRLEIILFLLFDSFALGFAFGEILRFGLKPVVPPVPKDLLLELDRWSKKPIERVQPVNITGSIEMHDVSFAYPNAGTLVIKNANLSIEAQKFYAFVGPSGSGKSTLMKLLMAQEIAQDGQVVFDGQDMRSLEPTLLHQHFGVVNQDSRPFSGSIRSNIICGRELGARDLEDLLYSHEIFDLLLDLPMGLETYVFDRATNISRLQSVVLLLARALVHKPKIIFLDEIFKGIGPDQQALISDYLQKLEITRVLVVHDLSKQLKPDFIFDQSFWHKSPEKQ